MAKLASMLLFFAICQTAFAQQGATLSMDSGGQLRSRIDSLNHKLKKDSLQTNWQNKIDSLKSLGNVNRYRDSLKVQGWADSLRTSVASSFTKKQNAIYNQVDSLLVRNQSTGVLQRKVDSLGRKQQVLMAEINQKQNLLQQKLSARYNKWNGELDSVRNKNGLPGVKAPDVGNVTDKLKLPGTTAQILNNQIPNLQSKLPGTLAPKLPTTPSLASDDFSDLNLSKDLQSAGGKISLPNTDQLRQWDNQLNVATNPPDLSAVNFSKN